MAHVFPFTATYYNPEKFPDLSTVITPPYDVISDAQATQFLARSPFNFAHVDLPIRDGDDYKKQKQTYEQWKENRALITSSQPSFYFYRQNYQWKDKAYTRDALVTTVGLADFSERVVLPHEHTHSKAKSDRLSLLRTFNAQLSHVFGVVKDEKNFLASLFKDIPSSKPLLNGRTDEGVQHKIWAIPSSLTPRIQEFFLPKQIYIVDGHHRYETSVAFAKECGAYKDFAKKASKAIFSICTTTDPGLIVLPTHRIVKGASDVDSLIHRAGSLFQVDAMTLKEVENYTDTPSDEPGFALGIKDKYFKLTPKNWKETQEKFGFALHKLSVHWSDRVFLKEIAGIADTAFAEHLIYEREFKSAQAELPGASFVIFQPQPRVTDMTDTADESKFMPPKSTYFYPKLASGVLQRELSPELE